MSISRRTLTALLMAAGVFLSISCGDSADVDSSMNDGSDITVSVVSHPDIHGWMELAVSQAPPVLSEAGETSAWLLFEGGNLLEFKLEDGKWKAWSIEGIGTVIDMEIEDDTPVFLTENQMHSFTADRREIVTELLPDGFVPVELSIQSGNLAILSISGNIAVRGPDGLEVYSSQQTCTDVRDLQLVGPDWVFRKSDGIALLDPSVDLWQYEESPSGGIMVASGNILYTEVNDSILARIAPGEWNFHAEGHLYPGGLLLTDAGISSVASPEDILADPPSFYPLNLFSLGHCEEPFWAIDDHGAAVFAQLGSVETNLPYYETERVSCSLAGQGSGGMQGSTGSIEDLILAGSGTFRIYESVSIRPDPFTEFSTTGQDARRNLESISIEEFRLVGITLDPVGGDQAMVEDGLGVPYVLYEGTILAYNSHVAEITSNEVIVIQDVIVDYSARGGGETTIPTIYSLRLHEEGGL